MVTPQQTKESGMRPKQKHFWWLTYQSDEATPFGGRNYNLDEIGRGEHIRKRTKKHKKPRKHNKKLSKRQAEDSDIPDAVDTEDDSGGDEVTFVENEIKLNEIDTQCPRGQTCVETFFCKRASGPRVEDRIPCLLQKGDFAGSFGICCRESFKRICPRVPIVPKPGECYTPGDPAYEECPTSGVRSNCSNSDDLCCFNGCINVCLEDPPYTVEQAFFIRQKAFIVGFAKLPSQDEDIDEIDNEDEDEYDQEDKDEKSEKDSSEDESKDESENEGEDFSDTSFKEEFIEGESISSGKEKNNLPPKLTGKKIKPDLFADPKLKRKLLRLIRKLRKRRRTGKRKTKLFL